MGTETGRAASQAWRAMGDDEFGVREVTGSNPGGNPIFAGVSIECDRLKHHVQLGLEKYMCWCRA